MDLDSNLIFTTNDTTFSFNVMLEDKNAIDIINKNSLLFLYDKNTNISSEIEAKEILNEYLSWRYFLGNTNIKPISIGSVYSTLINCDTVALKMMGDLDILFNDVLQLKRHYEENKIVDFLISLQINFSEINNFILLLGCFGYLSEYCGKNNLHQYNNSITSYLFSVIKMETLVKFKEYINKIIC
ncbi:protein A46 [BeAn 58058 virus]|uniref:protein A46 n=1 Tax=BeAn 58058 virus TaxID=67082 RepID=UPI00090A1BD8|nr:protein A46 [BeAn 58058 virus]APG58355.1 protein A46 [BeAn 58058 virus]